MAAAEEWTRARLPPLTCGAVMVALLMMAAEATEGGTNDVAKNPMRDRKLLSSFEPHLPDVLRLKHWWSNQMLLEQVLEEAEEQFQANIKSRDSHQGLQNFLHTGGRGSVKQHMDALVIPTYHCTSAQRLGSWVDGGKWVCLSHYQWRRTPTVLSVGCSGQTWFEKEVHRFLGVGVHTVDYSLTPQKAENVRSQPYILGLHEVGLIGARDLERRKRDHPDVKWVTLPQVLDIVQAKYVDILKIDCEHFCEYGVVADMAKVWTRENVPFGQVLIEMHLPLASLQQTLDTMKLMEDMGFRLFHSELNRFFDEPGLFHYEVAFIHESLVTPRRDGE